MFNYIHHAHYVVSNLDEALAYWEKHFGMRPEKVLARDGGQGKEAHFHVGQTLIRMEQPGSAQTPHGKFLKKNGPGLHHIAFGVDDVPETVQKFRANGTIPTDNEGVHASSHVYHTINFNGLGMDFQLADKHDF